MKDKNLRDAEMKWPKPQVGTQPPEQEMNDGFLSVIILLLRALE